MKVADGSSLPLGMSSTSLPCKLPTAHRSFFSRSLTSLSLSPLSQCSSVAAGPTIEAVHRRPRPRRVTLASPLSPAVPHYSLFPPTDCVLVSSTCTITTYLAIVVDLFDLIPHTCLLFSLQFVCGVGIGGARGGR